MISTQQFENPNNISVSSKQKKAMYDKTFDPKEYLKIRKRAITKMEWMDEMRIKLR